MPEMTFDLEQAMSRKACRDVSQGAHVFVAGLARAGTTILMRQFHATGAFRSLTYRDMPFVLAPNLWKRLSGGSRREMVAEERAHGDGVLVDFDSPEALDEVFWRVHAGEAYIRPDRLVPMEVDAETREKFRTYVALILRDHPDQRYLSKNNNNILRLGGIAASFPNALIVIPFRDPVAHALSLQRQHRQFIEAQEQDPFTLAYMNWLVHREFGQGHRPFVFGGTGAPLPQGDALGDLSYWLDLWQDTYAHLADAAPAQAVFVAYEQLCTDPAGVMAGLGARAGLPTPPEVIAMRAPEPAPEVDLPPEQVAKCRALYATLCDRAEGG